MAKKKFDKKSFVIASLRKASYRWPARSEALNKSKTAPNTYTCNMCKDSFGRKDVRLDHIDPIVDPTTGFIGWDSYVERLFCEVDGFQVLCDTCHDSKTMTERELRKQYRKLRKDEDNDKKK